MLYKLSGEVKKQDGSNESIFGSRYIFVDAEKEKLRELTTKFANVTGNTNPEKFVDYINENTDYEAVLTNKPVVFEISAKQAGYRGEKQGETTTSDTVFRSECPDCNWSGVISSNCLADIKSESNQHNNKTGHSAEPVEV